MRTKSMRFGLPAFGLSLAVLTSIFVSSPAHAIRIGIGFGPVVIYSGTPSYEYYDRKRDVYRRTSRRRSQPVYEYYDEERDEYRYQRRKKRGYRSRGRNHKHSKRVKQRKTRAVAKAKPLTRKIQIALDKLGYDTGPVDGIGGPRTIAAIKAYQLVNNAKSTGRLTRGQRLALLNGTAPKPSKSVRVIASLDSTQKPVAVNSEKTSKPKDRVNRIILPDGIEYVRKHRKTTADLKPIYEIKCEGKPDTHRYFQCGLKWCSTNVLQEPAHENLSLKKLAQWRCQG